MRSYKMPGTTLLLDIIDSFNSYNWGRYYLYFKDEKAEVQT